MKKLSKNIVRTLMVIGAMVMLMCAPVSAKTASSVKTVKAGKTFTIKNTSKVTSSKKAVAQAKKKNSNAWKITGLKKGKSTLKVYDKNGKLSEKVYLLVYNGNTFKYNTTAITMTKGDSKKVSASTNVSGVTVKYKSTDKNVATVNSNGKITAKGKGTATIKAVFYYKGVKVKTMKKSVTVKEAASASSSGSSSSSKSSSSSNSGSSSSSSGSSSSNSGSSSSGSGSSESESGFKNHTSLSVDSIAGGKTSTCSVYCEKASDVVTFTFSNDCAELGGITTGTCHDSYNHVDNAYYTRVSYVGRKAGTCNLGVYINGSLFKTIPITVTSTDENYYIYQEWKQNMKDEIWTDDMTDREKIDAACVYVRTHCVYISDQSGYMGLAVYGGGNCIAQADFIIDLAHDLGLEAEEYLVNGTYNGHVYAIVYYEPGVGTKVDIALS